MFDLRRYISIIHSIIFHDFMVKKAIATIKIDKNMHPNPKRRLMHQCPGVRDWRRRGADGVVRPRGCSLARPGRHQPWGARAGWWLALQIFQ